MDFTDITIRIRGTNVVTVSKSSGDSFDERPNVCAGTIGIEGVLEENDQNKGGFGRAKKYPDTFSHPAVIESAKKQTSDVDTYQHKKTIAQGMMDLALLSANANQLRYLLESYKGHTHFLPTVTFIAISIVLQVAVGVGLILNTKYNIKKKQEMRTANRINNFTTIGVFLVTMVNVFVCAIGVADSPDETSESSDRFLNSTCM